MAGVSYVNIAKPNAIADYKPIENTLEAYTPGTYTSQYGDRLSSALDTVTNWKYDPLKDASYQALAKVYGKRGNIAAKNSLADAASLNGGYGTSYAVSAAQQARNQYNQELASLIPDLEANAYQKATGTLNALRDADNTAYGRFRDTEGDRQWQYTQNYQKYRDAVSDSQWQYQQNYQKYRDLMSDYQWGQNYNMDVYQLKKASSGGGGRRSSGGGGGGGYSSGSSASANDLYWLGSVTAAAKKVGTAVKSGTSASGKNIVPAVKAAGRTQSKKK